MPVLSREADLFPECLFDPAQRAELGERLWWVMHTRPRQEKSLARELYTRQTPFYLPVIPRRWRSRGRVMTSHVPLFSGYVFVLADGEERVATLGTHRVVRSLEVPDQEGLWGDLRQIEQLLASGAPVTPEDRFQPGTTVEIRRGPLAGLRGTILRGASGRRFVVQVNFIQRGASVLLDDFDLAELN